MTKVEVRFRLTRPLDLALLTRLAGIHALYGIKAIAVAPGQDSLVVEYDATRLSPADVEAALARIGVPLAPVAA
jgi:hypothetical protein